MYRPRILLCRRAGTSSLHGLSRGFHDCWCRSSWWQQVICCLAVKFSAAEPALRRIIGHCRMSTVGGTGRGW